jgi:hypothetical protein
VDIIVCDVVAAKFVTLEADVVRMQVFRGAAVGLELRMDAGDVLALVERHVSALLVGLMLLVTVALLVILLDRLVCIDYLPLKLDDAPTWGSPFTRHDVLLR